EERAGVARVLAQDEIRLRQLAEHAQRDVVEVADRRRADRERHGYAGSSASCPTSAAPIIPASGPSSARTMRTTSRPGGIASRATISRTGSRRRSPAAAKPPPTTT